MVEKFGVGKFLFTLGVGKFMVEKFMVEKFMVEISIQDEKIYG